MKRLALGAGIILFALFIGMARGQTGAAEATAVPDTGKKLVDINTATPQELDALPGIGEAYTRAIIEGRPYKDKRELRWRKIVPRGTFEKIRNRITALTPRTDARPADKLEARPAEEKAPPAPAAKDKSSPLLVK
jgi:hypothetical protein